MKLAKKDKIMLLVLGVIMFVAIFFVYMIMPAKDEGKALDAQIATKKAEAQKVATDLAKIDTATIQRQIDELYDYYYAQKEIQKDKPNGLHPLLTKDKLEQMMDKIFSDPSRLVEGYDTASWTISKTSREVTKDNVSAIVDMYVANMPIRFRAKSLSHLENILDYFYKDPYFRVVDVTLAENHPQPSKIAKPEKAEDERLYIAAPSEEEAQYQFEATIKLEFYMGDKYTTDKIPAPLDSTAVEVVEGTKIKFYGVENAIRYELYEFTYNDFGNRVYKKVNNISIALKEGNAEYEVIVPDGVFKDGKEHNIVVKAIGDQKKGFYATALDSKTPFVVLKK